MFTSMDVYDAAASIGRECQLLVGEYGEEALETLLPKVISVLEELELCAIYGEREQEEVERLQNVMETLRGDCRAQVELKQQADKNMEQLEQSWYCDTQRLLEQVTALEKENDRLAQQLISTVPGDTSAIDAPTTEDDEQVGLAKRRSAGAVLRIVAAGQRAPSPFENSTRRQEEQDEMITSVLSETEGRLKLSKQENHLADLQMIGRLKECTAGNYKAIRALNGELIQNSAALDAAEMEVCRLARQSGELMIARAPHRRQTGQLVAEKASVESKLRVRERELAELNRRLPLERRMNSNGEWEVFSTLSGASGVMSENGGGGQQSGQVKLVASPTSALPPTVHLALGQGMESAACEVSSTVNDGDGLVTLEELRHLLYERNELRCRVIELEHQLELLELENSDDPEVEGPMLREPIDKIRPGWYEKPSIKTIFRQLLHRLTERSPTSD